MTIANSSLHEVVVVFEQHGLALSSKLMDMLNEHYTHQTERRGCGYTQATRVLAEYINKPRDADALDDLKIVPDLWERTQHLLSLARRHGLALAGWRHLAQQETVQQCVQSEQCNPLLLESLQRVMADQDVLLSLVDKMQYEESRLITQLIVDIILPPSPDNTLTSLHILTEKPKVGSCPMAEKFFLEIGHRKLLRQGYINILTDDAGKPLLLEKMNMGDNHSCISLVPMMINGVRLPVGCLLAVSYDDAVLAKQPNKQLAGHVIRAADCDGFWLLRLTTLAVSPQNRRRAFSTHFQQQVTNGLFSPDVTTLNQLLTVAQEQLS